MSILTELHRDDSLAAQKRKVFEQQIDWEEHIKTLEKKEEITELQIPPNKFKFKDDKLIITKEDFPNLKTLQACGLKLWKVELDCPSLENLYLVDNEITQIDFKKTPNLKSVYLSKNSIHKLRVKHLKKLEDLRVNKNCLIDLDVRGLTNLINLDASGCLREPDDYGYGNIRRLEKIKLGNNPKLKLLDLAENNIANFNFPFLPNLKTLSLRENSYSYDLRMGWVEPWKTITVRSPKLTILDYNGYSNIKDFKIHEDYPLENPNQLTVCNNKSYQNEDGTLNLDAPTLWEQAGYELQQEIEQREYEAGDNIFEGKVCVDLSNRNYIKSILIDGDTNYPKSVESINLGGNYLEIVIIKNLPNLVQLILSHNKVKTLRIVNCPKLSIIYNYKSDDPTREVPVDNAQEYNEETDNPIKNEEKEEIKILAQIIRLLEQAQEVLEKQDYQELARLLAQIKQLAEKEIEGLNRTKLEEMINKFEQALLTQQNTSNKKPWPLIISSIIIIPIILGIFVLLAKKWIANDFNQQVSKLSKKKKKDDLLN